MVEAGRNRQWTGRVKDARAAGVSFLVAVEPTPLRLADYVTLTKPRLNVLVSATSAAGYYLAASGSVDISVMGRTIAGTALVAAGAAVLNQVYERDTDALMRRTRMRPLPDGRVRPADAQIFGGILGACGLAVLTAGANLLAASVALATLIIYLAVYTPMKRQSPLSPLVGAVPGALPPLIGWTAAHGALSTGGIVLFAIVFLWQIPHFMAIAWLYRDDYDKAGFPLWPVIEPDGRSTGRYAVLFSAMLVPTSLVPSLIGLSGTGAFSVALILGVSLLSLSVRFARSRTGSSARALFLGSIVYLPLLWIAMICNKVGFSRSL